MITITKVFLIIGCILNGLEIIPLLWCIPMTIHYFTYVRDYNPLSITFKICCLLFISPISGILMLVDKNQ